MFLWLLLLYSFCYCNSNESKSINASLLENLNKALSNANDTIKVSFGSWITMEFLQRFQSEFETSRNELRKFDDILKNTSESYKGAIGRFLQVENRQPVSEETLRDSLYSTMPMRSTPQAIISIQAQEICKNVQNELERMKSSNGIRLNSIALHSKLMKRECKEASCRDEENNKAKSKFMPPTRSELGRAGWLYLHSMAARFPEKPDEMESLKTKAWLYSFAELYPCHICRDGLVDLYRSNPPNTSNRQSLLMWTFKIHNLVNQDLSMPLYQATYESLMQRYFQF
ncbi:bifunctional ERV-ALR sulfhydryl oxidase domain superfamily/ERV-ALR sulfhydryl oxidase domain/Sulfhydryl oxidase ALR-ERV [Babesia duncani]|uniref:Sulfhydryl oxidase n=1 Tax=Babesia duncani TaxID=323732 RepID=A0AAD9UN49_9APIC|nr:bifunctional ERV-ALR sulfhydryl oxidase domain superfamily/ERV-ALR sulfhydryl oxidase domain/Sulfhydryl oxidase ALR-ERV [Babesia duncani]